MIFIPLEYVGTDFYSPVFVFINVFGLAAGGLFQILHVIPSRSYFIVRAA